MLRSICLTTVATVAVTAALAFPSSASAHPWDGHGPVIYRTSGYPYGPGYGPAYFPQPHPQHAIPYRVYYRTAPCGPWLYHGCYPTFHQARCIVTEFQPRALEIVIR